MKSKSRTRAWGNQGSCETFKSDAQLEIDPAGEVAGGAHGCLQAEVAAPARMDHVARQAELPFGNEIPQDEVPQWRRRQVAAGAVGIAAGQPERELFASGLVGLSHGAQQAP